MNFDDNPVQQRILRIIAAVTLIFILRLAQFTIVQKSDWQKRASDRIYETIEIEPVRGRILCDGGHKVLADSHVQISVASDNYSLKRIGYEAKIASNLADALEIPMERILSAIHHYHNASWIARDISEKHFIDIITMKQAGKLPRIYIKREITREYPSHPLAGPIVGFIRKTREPGFEVLGQFQHSAGVEGLEKAYNRELTGTRGIYQYKINRFSAPIKSSFECIRPVTHGADLSTTIRSNIQLILHEELQVALEENQAESANGIILDPLNGAIIAASSVENIPEHYDPWFLSSTPINCWTPHARRCLPALAEFEPGSIWKPVMMTLALEHGLVKPGEMLPWKPGIVVGGHAFYDWRKFDDTIRLSDVLTFSSNVGIIQVSKRIFSSLDHSDIAMELERLGFNRELPIDFFTQASGQFNDKLWSRTTIAALAEGYEIMVTLPQLAAFYAAVANGGMRVDPHFGESFLDSLTGQKTEDLEPTIQQQLMSPRTSRFITEAMKACVDHGTGRKGNISDYGVLAAGKTATAKLSVAGTYNSGKYRASFAGFFPADDPQYVMVISIVDPTAGSYYGGQVAAPVFRAVASRMLEDVHGIHPIPLPDDYWDAP